jgi:hypothetical protein
MYLDLKARLSNKFWARLVAAGNISIVPCVDAPRRFLYDEFAGG